MKFLESVLSLNEYLDKDMFWQEQMTALNFTFGYSFVQIANIAGNLF